MNYRQAYLDLQKKHQDELTNFPIAYAFSQKQLEEALEKLGAKKEECVTVMDCGDIMKRTDVPAFHEMLERQDEELREAMKDKDFAEASFLYEMDNHEYAINWDGDADVMACFGLTYEKLDELGLREAYLKARKQHMKNAEEWELI